MGAPGQTYGSTGEPFCSTAAAENVVITSCVKRRGPVDAPSHMWHSGWAAHTVLSATGSRSGTAVRKPPVMPAPAAPPGALAAGGAARVVGRRPATVVASALGGTGGSSDREVKDSTTPDTSAVGPLCHAFVSSTRPLQDDVCVDEITVGGTTSPLATPLAALPAPTIAGAYVPRRSNSSSSSASSSSSYPRRRPRWAGRAATGSSAPDGTND
jgi:hypothetical protein